MITQERLREMLYYHPESGDFVWLKRTAQTDRTGLQAGKLHHSGYTDIKIEGRWYRAHRLAFLYMTGKFPADEADHRDLDRANNAWSNLREATRAQNGQNRLARKDSGTGVKGIMFYRRYGKYVAQIKANGCCHWLGYFETLEGAQSAWNEAAKNLHGEFARAVA